MKFSVTIKNKKGEFFHEVTFDADDSGSVCYAMGFIEQALEDGLHVEKIEHD